MYVLYTVTSYLHVYNGTSNDCPCKNQRSLATALQQFIDSVRKDIPTRFKLICNNTLLLYIYVTLHDIPKMFLLTTYLGIIRSVNNIGWFLLRQSHTYVTRFSKRGLIHAQLRDTFCHHLLATSMDQQYMRLILLKLKLSAFTQASFPSPSDVHVCLGGFQMTPSSGFPW